MLNIIDQSLSELLGNSAKKLTVEDRIQIFIENMVEPFTRKDYLNYFNFLNSSINFFTSFILTPRAMAKIEIQNSQISFFLFGSQIISP